MMGAALLLGLVLAQAAAGAEDSLGLSWEMRWVRVGVEIETVGGETLGSGQNEGSVTSWSLHRSSMVWRERSLAGGKLLWDINSTFEFSAPLSLAPGAVATALMEGASQGESHTSWVASAGARIQWVVNGKPGRVAKSTSSLGNYPDPAEATATAPAIAEGNSLQLVAYLYGCKDECRVVWEYAPMAVDRASGEPLPEETCAQRYLSEVFVRLCAETLRMALAEEEAEPPDCDAPAPEHLAYCVAAAAVEAGDLALCPQEPPAREECSAMVAAETGDLVALNRIEDPEARESISCRSLGKALASVLAGEDTPLPADGMCEGLSGEWADPEGYGADNAKVNRWVCKEMVTTILVAAARDPVLCASRARGWRYDDLAERMPRVLDTSDPTPEEAVSWEERSCLDLLADLERFDEGLGIPLG